MATYKGIKGFSIQNLSADPSNPIEGEMWYNSTSNVWKVEEVTTAGAWASGGNMGTLGTARYAQSGAGTLTAGLISSGGANATGGVNVATEEYDGSTWTAGGNVATARRFLAGGGVQTAAVIFGGIKIGSPPVADNTEEYNGTSWSPGGNLNTARTGLGGCGTQTAALAFGGDTPPVTGATESYDGTAWTTIPATLATARERVNLGPAGSQTSALLFGGFTGTARTAATEEFTGAGAAVTKTITVS
jgi:hypothetical protein